VPDQSWNSTDIYIEQQAGLVCHYISAGQTNMHYC